MVCVHEETGKASMAKRELIAAIQPHIYKEPRALWGTVQTQPIRELSYRVQTHANGNPLAAPEKASKKDLSVKVASTLQNV